jgi:hypothetical protein
MKDKMLERAASFYDGSPTGQYDDIAALAIRIVSCMHAGDMGEADMLMEQIDAMCNDD